MRIHAISVIKNEADIIQYTLKEALTWADYIYVFDNGSDDGTWEKVQELASDRVIAWKHDDQPFRESLRGQVFNHFKARAEPGDWWCRLDGDELYNIQSPRQFLDQVHPSYHVVWGISVEYYITVTDLSNLDFSLPAEALVQHLRYYSARTSEPRFFRHRKNLRWPADGAWPLHMGLVNNERILFKHYKYRSPAQTQTRLDTRRLSRDRGFPGWEHATEFDWKDKVLDTAELHYDKKDGHFKIDWHLLPKHEDPFKKRVVKQLMHSLGIWP